MIQDRQVKRLWRTLALGKTLAQSADKAGHGREDGEKV
jgi:hypothetical protein